LDIVTIVVPPALPAAMTVGTVYAQSRLKKKSIYCISPPRINFCGKLKLICFDKTGTLTEEGLDLWCVVPVKKVGAGKTDFLEATGEPEELDSDNPLLRAMASCHSLTYISGNIVGDPLDLKMFASTGWELEEPSPDQGDIQKFDLLTPTVVKKDGLELGIIREFEFNSQLQRMSVVVKSLDGPGMMLYAKGAPEKIRALCSSGIPDNFDKVLDSFTVKGYRVLAMASRQVKDVKWHQIQRVHRDKVRFFSNSMNLLINNCTNGVLNSIYSINYLDGD
jgi:cation-transporting ATPase 13A2